MKRVEVRFTGHVQGVGFRYTTQRIATRWRVAGYVENQSDDSVLLVAEGEHKELQKFLEEITSEMEAHINNAEIHWYAASGEWSAFSIRR